jgi:hypothetical protein
MSFVRDTLAVQRPRSVRDVALPRRVQAFPSPGDWRDEIIYFLLPDRFSDGREGERSLLDPADAAAFRPNDFRFDAWADSGSGRYQGGTIAGITSKLDYIRHLGATTLWVAPFSSNGRTTTRTTDTRSRTSSKSILASDRGRTSSIS